MSIQTQILDLLLTHATRQLSYIFITHDIQAATYLCDELIILKMVQLKHRCQRQHYIVVRMLIPMRH